MDFKRADQYKPLILRIFLALTVIFWGYEKLTLEKLVKSYTMDYEQLMFLDVNMFLDIAGWLQIILGFLLILGLLTRANAFVVAIMGMVTILVPGVIIMKDVPHFAYAFALTGAALALLIEGGGEYSVDKYIFGSTHKCYPVEVCEIPG
jgi:uncharacterized membrane protein YphA (DoxX/SURF4 family)